ncbi:alpha-galactosidase [Microbacterium sp. M3]|uniref:Alpha-galactosidase n=1 Tax=Microbacterium arthrosphaerae TaxID=792652 RepID=A0ABU4GXW0_9MICO|nr:MULTISPECIES: alpha-galactosidase [Microbacterium]MDW4571922.1 alpha-galactosidase [Microbacterium arthrosphaerae]MDW7605777.1 alpha-galactosidase [Microbacterium sp. M3]
MTKSIIHLHSEGVSLLIDARGPALPAVLHWGASLGSLRDGELASIADALSRQTPPATLDAAWENTILPTEGDGWSGRPGLQVSRDGAELYTRWVLTDVRADATTCEFTAMDAAAALTLRSRLEIGPGGVVWVTHRLRHDDGSVAAPVVVGWLEATLPVPDSTTHATTLDGRWSREKRAVTTEIAPGATTRASRRGRPGHDAATVTALSERSPEWHRGRVWATHIAWSADTTYRVDRVTEAVTLLGGGELLRSGEVVLRPGDEYAAPPTAFAWSDRGLDGIAAGFHRWLRARPQHPQTPRPFTLNTWEAVYFDHDHVRLERLAERAAEVGVERFVLDDGWFLGRRDDTTSLGDWVVDPAAWPDGLRPLADSVHGLGMQFGLWFEPEMISIDSDLARSHPDWFLHDPRHLTHDPSLSWRTQYVLDIANPEAYAHILDRIDTLINEIGIDYIKWDHNRDLVESVHDGRPGLHAHTVAVYRLIAELKERHPALEIESCSSGGARTDLGILNVTDRVWASDSNDPVERQDIQRWTGLLLPPELIGAHVGPTTSHSSGRTTDLSYRMATSLMGSAGLEWDILSCDAEETAAIARFAALYKELRPLLRTATVTHPPIRDDAWRITAYTAPDASAAVVLVATVSGLDDARAERLRLPELDAARHYRITMRTEIGEVKAGWILPPWISAGETVLPGAALIEIGIQLPTLWPLQAMVLHITAID